jgi:hypothetical protein
MRHSFLRAKHALILTVIGIFVSLAMVVQCHADLPQLTTAKGNAIPTFFILDKCAVHDAYRRGERKWHVCEFFCL